MPLEVEVMVYKKVKWVSCGGRMTAACVIRAWVQDQETKSCMACKLKFTAVRRRVRVLYIDLIPVVSGHFLTYSVVGQLPHQALL